MSIINQTYNIAKQRQLIDLNGDMINFDITFTATSKDGKTFNIIVVDQEKIDSNAIADMQYKIANGSISGNVVEDKNIHKNYYLCLKADTPCEVNIKIERMEIPPRKILSKQVRTPPMPQPKKSYMTIKNVSLFCVLVVGVGFLWHFYFQKKGDEQGDTSLSEDISLSEDGSALSPGPSGLLNKLRGLSM